MKLVDTIFMIPTLYRIGMQMEKKRWSELKMSHNYYNYTFDWISVWNK